MATPFEQTDGALVNGRPYQHPDDYWFEVTNQDESGGLVVLEPAFIGGTPPLQFEIFELGFVWSGTVEHHYGPLSYEDGAVSFYPGLSGIYRVVLTDAAGYQLEWPIGIAVLHIDDFGPF
jgi:hypothetical protein